MPKTNMHPFSAVTAAATPTFQPTIQQFFLYPSNLSSGFLHLRPKTLQTRFVQRLTYIPDTSERNLVEGCLRNDRQAQRRLYELYKKAMFSRAFRLLNDYDEANDALQEAFVKVFRDLRSFRFQSSLGAWIKTILIREAVRRQQQRFFVEPITDSLLPPPDLPDTLTGEQLDAAIRQLPDGCRAVFLLLEVEGYTHRETAEMLGISEGTSKSQLSHAKKLLRKQLAEFGT
mgnify:CR=1 FL=1